MGNLLKTYFSSDKKDWGSLKLGGLFFWKPGASIVFMLEDVASDSLRRGVIISSTVPFKGVLQKGAPVDLQSPGLGLFGKSGGR